MKRARAGVARISLSSTAMLSERHHLCHALLAALCSATVATAALATPVPMLEHTAAGIRPMPQRQFRHAVAPKQLTSGKPIWAAPPMKSTGLDETVVELSVDPTTGATNGTITLKLRALQGSVGSFSLMFDQGLSVTAASASGSTVTSKSQSFPPFNYVTFIVSPPLSQGEQRDVTVQYSGNLQCPGPGGSTVGEYCNLAPPLGVLMEGSALPSIIDQSNLAGYNIWGAKRFLTLHMPTKTDVIASGHKKSDVDDGTTRTTTWEVPGYHTAGPYLVLFGDLEQSSVAGTTPATSIFLPKALPAWKAELADWMQRILPFLDTQAGQPLPFPELSVVKLPPGWTLPGTAGDGYVLLAEDYGAYGSEYFEETLAHETSHDWWGILVAPTDLARTRWLTEGLATLTQIDYSAEKFPRGFDRETYLARRYNEHHMLLRYVAVPEQPPLVAPSQQSIPQDQIQNTIWAYMRSSATLDHLRVIVGEKEFASALQDWVSQCAKQYCDTEDFRKALEARSGKDLQGTFATWVYDTVLPAPKFSFSQKALGERQEVVVTTSGAPGNHWLRLQIEYLDGTSEQRTLQLPGEGSLTLDLPKRVRSLRPDRRHDAVLWSTSAQAGDVNFDQDVDGFDLIHCALQVGRKTGPQLSGTEGLMRYDLDFDTRCDPNLDGSIDDADLQSQLDNFATVRPEAP
ncbi:MAG TPA: M1 family aminopeptidase [Polyangiaceae bacterium]|nr:M1 family aminopeptidase [Polyangiaceae bacterium]